jgi:uncharacterized protein (TIGR02678 family)
VPVTTIGLLADRVTTATSTDEVVSRFDTSSRAERMAFVDVLRMLEHIGVLDVVDGTTESFVDSAAAKVLYRVDATLLLRMLAAPVGPSQLGVPPDEVALRFDELLAAVSREQRYGTSTGRHEATAPASEVQRNLWLRHSIFRRLVDDPVVHLDDLTDDERAYLASPTGRRLLRGAADQGGFELEERAEGVLLVDVDGIATDSRFPDDSATAKVAALFVLDTLHGPTTIEQIEHEAATLLGRFPRWAKSYRGDDGARQLVIDAVAILTSFGLARLAGAVVYPLPAAARYAIGELRTPDPSTEESS